VSHKFKWKRKGTMTNRAWDLRDLEMAPDSVEFKGLNPVESETGICSRCGGQLRAEKGKDGVVIVCMGCSADTTKVGPP